MTISNKVVSEALWGLGVASRDRLYVTGLGPERNAVILGPSEDLYRTGLRAEVVDWVSIAPPGSPLTAAVKVRYNGPETPAEVIPAGENEVVVRFRQPVLPTTDDCRSSYSQSAPAVWEKSPK